MHRPGPVTTNAGNEASGTIVSPPDLVRKYLYLQSVTRKRKILAHNSLALVLVLDTGKDVLVCDPTHGKEGTNEDTLHSPIIQPI